MGLGLGFGSGLESCCGEGKKRWSIGLLSSGSGDDDDEVVVGEDIEDMVLLESIAKEFEEGREETVGIMTCRVAN